MAQVKAFTSISARLDPQLAQLIMDEAEQRGVSNRVVIADALKEHFDRKAPRTLKTGENSHEHENSHEAHPDRMSNSP